MNALFRAGFKRKQRRRVSRVRTRRFYVRDQFQMMVPILNANFRLLSEQVRKIDVREWQQKANANLRRMKRHAIKCKNEMMEATNAYRKRDRKKIVRHPVREVDGGFFEKFGSQLKIAAEPTQEIKDEENRERVNYQDETESTESGSTLSDSQPSLTSVLELNAEDLFCDVYYQCTHLIGQETSIKKDSLVAFMKELFEFDDAKCKILVDSAKQKPAPKMLLKVDVIEAKDLSPKDATGFSDPYCVLYVSSLQTQRFSTNVQRQTLTPHWEEHFKLPVSSSTNDVLFFEVWDFDEAETIGDKVKKVGDVKGFRGVRKLVKELAQTISTGKHDSELIGAAQVTLKNIPATGQLAWFQLTKKKKNNVKSGMILLRMVFGSEKDERVALEEHRYLVKTLLQNLMKNPEFDLSTWDGLFSAEGELILRQHVAQSNIGTTEDLVAKFVEYVSLHQNKSMNYGVIADVLVRLSANVKAGNLNEDEATLYWNTARKLLPSCFNAIRKIRKSAPGDKKILIQLDAILCIIEDLSNVTIPADVTLLPSQIYTWVQTTDKFTIKSILHEAVLNGAYDWFEYLATHNKPENNSDEATLRHLVKLTQLIHLDLQGAKEHHERLFKERLNFPYSKTLFAVYQASLVEIIGSVVTDMCMMMKPLDFEKRNDKDANNDPLTTGTTMFELFLTLQHIDRLGCELFQNDDALETFAIRKYYTWFFTGVVRWLDIAAYKAMQRIEKAVELDDFIPIDSTVQYSSSAIDAMAIFHQVKTFWDQLSWPDVEGSYTFIAKIIDDICKSSVHYADRVAAKVDGMGETQTTYATKFDVTNEWCVAINNIDYIHHGIEPFVKELGLDTMLNSLEEFKNAAAAEHCKRTLQLVMENAVENVGNKIADLIQTLVDKMEPSIIRFLQEGAELLHQQSNILDRLMQYLDDTLMTLNNKLNPDNFNRVLDVMWVKLSLIITRMVDNGIEKRRPPSYFENMHQTLHVLISFFRLDAEKESNKLARLAEVERLLTIYGMETQDLIHEYHLERLIEQNQIEKSEDGEIAITLQLDSDKLYVGILNARNIRPMDSNGYCDPFVSFRMLPKNKFPGVSKQTTKVHKKTLFPLFDEKFTIPFSSESQCVKDALIFFVMKDQDFYGAKNDYMAEAYVRVSEASNTRSGDYPKQIHLMLNRPKNSESDILKALDFRQGDKLARDFVKKQKAKIDTSR